ncbi:MAG: esterase [Subtercola sp.]|nr:esterase [Subtercola sp.]
MMDRIAAILGAARRERVFSAAAWSYGDAKGPWGRGMLGTLAWDDADGAGCPDVAESSLWDLASVTKPIVAMAVMSLVESGELTLDDTIGDHLADYRDTDKAGIAVRDLLTHTSGIPGQIPLFQWNPTSDGLLRAIRTLPLLAPAGTEVVYSSQGFIVLGLIAEAASGMPLDDLVRCRVLEPAGTTDTGFGLPENRRAEAVATEDDPWRGRMVQGEVHDENAVVLGRPAGHAGLFATLADLEALGQALCARGAGHGGRLLSSSSYRVMIAPRTDHLRLRRTLGWQGVDPVGSPAGDLVGPNGFGHTGFTGTSIWVDPEAGRYSVLLTNRVHPTRSSPAFNRVRRAVNNVAFAAPTTTHPPTADH